MSDDCGHCRFWNPFGVSVKHPLGNGEGRCQRRSPATVVLHPNTYVGVKQWAEPIWPTTGTADWCGDYEPALPAAAP